MADQLVGFRKYLATAVCESRDDGTFALVPRLYGAAKGSLHPALLLTAAIPNLFGADGRINQPDRLRVLLDAVVTQELGPSACPQPPRGESWIGCRVDDAVFNRAVESLGDGRSPTPTPVTR